VDARGGGDGDAPENLMSAVDKENALARAHAACIGR
jgi:hypothetical protein